VKYQDLFPRTNTKTITPLRGKAHGGKHPNTRQCSVVIKLLDNAGGKSVGSSVIVLFWKPCWAESKLERNGDLPGSGSWIEGGTTWVPLHGGGEWDPLAQRGEKKGGGERMMFEKKLHQGGRWEGEGIKPIHQRKLMRTFNGGRRTFQRNSKGRVSNPEWEDLYLVEGRKGGCGCTTAGTEKIVGGSRAGMAENVPSRESPIT